MNSAVAIALLMSALGQADSDEPASRDEEQQERAKRLEFMKRTMAEYDIFLGDGTEEEHRLTLQQEPVYRWTWPVQTIYDGATFVWTKQGRPEAVTQMFVFREPRHRWVHMFTSFSQHPLRAERAGSRVWFPTQAGVDDQRVSDSPPPAETPALRLRQMRSIVREFDASIDLLGKERFQLRPVTQPMFRYGNEEGDVIDGGLFAFCEGTNPKLLLRLEARRGDWFFAIAPVTVHAAEVMHLGKSVFQIPYRQEPTLRPDDTFFNRIIYVSEPTE